MDPESLHPFLDDLDWRREPESLAWTRAPYEKTAFAQTLMANAGAVKLREHVPVGAVGPAHEIARKDRAPANDIAAAVLALARCGSFEAVADLERWIADSGTAPHEVNDLLIITGWELCSRCSACGAPLLRLLTDPSNNVLTIPLFICADCAVVDIQPYYTELTKDGEPVPRLRETPPKSFEPTIRRASLPAPLSVTFEPAPAAVPDDLDSFEELTRIGGVPSWVQGPQNAGHCPKCSTPMEFVAQFPDPPGAETWSGGDSGMFYVFGCTRCRIIASFFQST